MLAAIAELLRYQASLMTSIDSSKISRLMRSCSADISLSPLATTVPNAHASRHGASADTELHPTAGDDVGEREVLGEPQRMPLRHDIEHLPQAKSCVCIAKCCPNWMRLGSTS